jgi:hypothetical protein
MPNEKWAIFAGSSNHGDTNILVRLISQDSDALSGTDTISAITTSLQQEGYLLRKVQNRELDRISAPRKTSLRPQAGRRKSRSIS